MIGAFYGLGKDSWSGAETIWEGTFALIASIIITAVGFPLLRMSKMQEKWRVKIAKALESKRSAGDSWWSVWVEKYAMLILPFITVLREGVEAVMFVGGVSVGQPASSIPLPVVAGLAAGILVGFLLYK